MLYAQIQPTLIMHVNAIYDDGGESYRVYKLIFDQCKVVIITIVITNITDTYLLQRRLCGHLCGQKHYVEYVAKPTP